MTKQVDDKDLAKVTGGSATELEPLRTDNTTLPGGTSGGSSSGGGRGPTPETNTPPSGTPDLSQI